MKAGLTAYLFRDGHFAPSGDTVVCLADRLTIEAALGRGQLEILFQGGAVYTDGAMKLDYIGVWGARNASRLRRLLRECGFEIVIDRRRPPNVRLRYFTHGCRQADRIRKQRALSVGLLRNSCSLRSKGRSSCLRSVIATGYPAPAPHVLLLACALGARAMDANVQVDRFLRASRSLFNGFFSIDRPWANPHRAWDLRDCFGPVEAALFQALVLRPLRIEGPSYGCGPQVIRVLSKIEGAMPIMINRDVDSGYWDHPLRECSTDADLRFIKFFDWSDIDRRDNRYVVVWIEDWPTHPEVSGKQALIESYCCTYRLANATVSQ
jgi:hypothetical protein